jgi:hypothetical protein
MADFLGAGDHLGEPGVNRWEAACRPTSSATPINSQVSPGLAGRRHRIAQLGLGGVNSLGGRDDPPDVRRVARILGVRLDRVEPLIDRGRAGNVA